MFTPSQIAEWRANATAVVEGVRTPQPFHASRILQLLQQADQNAVEIAELKKKCEEKSIFEQVFGKESDSIFRKPL